MNLDEILTYYDNMFGKYSLEEIERYLAKKIEEAEKVSEIGIVISLLNELIGFCRDTTQKEKALFYCEQLQTLLSRQKLEGRIDYATSLLNIANAYRAFGLWKESLQLYGIVEDIFARQLAPTDFLFASLYNNKSLLYQEMQEYENARDMLLKALVIADSYEDAVMEQASTKTNLAAALLQIGTQEAVEEAKRYLEEALAVHERNGGADFHYAAVLAAMGDASMCQKEYEAAAAQYEKALIEIEKHVGKTDNYDRVLEKYKYAKAQFKRQADTRKAQCSAALLEQCEQFYQQYGKPMIEEKFPAYANRIAVGLVGEGSDCFGFDDAISADHDYAIGFCMWLTEEDYVRIGEALQKSYLELVGAHTKNEGNNLFLSARRGVFSIAGFYHGLLDTEVLTEGEAYDFWLTVPEQKLATAVNGKVFADPLGEFSRVRTALLRYYPEEIWRRRLAQSLHEFSQYAQSNYPRMMARKDLVTAQLCVGKAMESAMDMVFLLQKVYAPYYKWKRKAIAAMAEANKGTAKDCLAAKILPLLQQLVLLPPQDAAWETEVYTAAAINTKDERVIVLEQIAALLLAEMKRQGLSSGEDIFLESHIASLLQGKNKKQDIQDKGAESKQAVKEKKDEQRMDIIEKIVAAEWKQFDKVQNEGGRAGCQDDFTTFSIMRRSQYMTWEDELLCSYYEDLLEAEKKGWNLITEKYARMMESTAPEKYAELKKEIPKRSEERIVIQEEIIRIQVGWMEEFKKRYPNMASNARTIHTSEDTAYNTSYETYLRGEIGTYSENTFLLYGRFIAELLQEERNLAYETMQNTARLYGYASVEEAEKALG